MERVTYSEDLKNAFFGGYRFRLDAKTGYYLATKPTDGKRRERLHCYVWRYFNGPVPDGFHVHHMDEDKGHNDIENLSCIPKFNHLSLHGKEYAKNNHEQVMQNLKENAIPKASDWHRSEVGRAWHAEQAKKNAQNMEERPFICRNCGKIFYKKPLGANKFCSNNCKSAARRESGVDNETRTCIVCGKEYVCNKYSSQRCCGLSCSSTLRWDQERQKNRESACVQHGG